MKHRGFLIHCLSPLHAGTGQSIGHIDLPIARYKATGIPYVPGSSIKGVVRDAATPEEERPDAKVEGADDDARREKLDNNARWTNFLAAFGPDAANASEHAGAVTFGDARLLAMPVRSLRGTFAYVTCPLLLRLAQQELATAGAGGVPTSIPLPAAPDKSGVPSALVPDSMSVLSHTPQGDNTRRLYLEDLDFNASDNTHAAAWADWLGKALFEGQTGDLRERFVVVADEVMTFIWEMSTQVDAHNRINDRGTVADGQLWWEENLPAETVLVGFASATAARRRRGKTGVSVATEDAMLDLGVPRGGHPFLQLGGKATVGKGRARLIAL